MSGALAGLLAGALLGAGCAGSSPQLSAPSLAGTNSGSGSAAGGGATRAAGGLSAAEEASLPALEAVKTPDGTFLAEPYLQWGKDSGKKDKGETLALLWQTPAGGEAAASASAWTVETRPAGKGEWRKSEAAPTEASVSAAGVTPHRVWTAPLTGLTPGQLFDYRVLENNKPVFSARARARRASSGDPYRFVLFGDCGANTPAQRKVAYQTSLARPDFVFITGDIVYDRGLASEYQKKFFPIYNAATASPETGAPLMRSTLFISAPGNHDLEYHDLEKYPDGLAYFDYWNQPLDGPTLKAGEANTPRLVGPEGAQKTFLTGAGDRYPRMANYSFDYGNAHWTVLDSDPYVDWTNPELRAWLEKDLASAKNAGWRFVAFHHPPFNSSTKHRDDQQMRVICDLLEKYRVDVVWAGHVHNYQRTHPLTFVAEKGADGKLRDARNRVAGKWTLDTTYDGDKNTRPKGILYIISGGGGGPLYDPDIQQKPADWLPFTAKYIADTHSFTEADVNGATLTVRQISEDGKELDKFTVTK